MKKNINAADVLLLFISLAFLFGMLFVFYPCAPKEDGSFMNCHWAGNTVMGLAAVLSVISLSHLIIPVSEIKAGLSAAVIPVSVLTILIPGKIIDMCMMNDMRCQAMMKPAVTVSAILMIIISAFDIMTRCRMSAVPTSAR